MSTVTPESVQALSRVQVLSGRLSRTSNAAARTELERDLSIAKVDYALTRQLIPDELSDPQRSRIADIAAGFLLRVAGERSGAALRRARKAQTSSAE